MDYPGDLKYTKEHEWIRSEQDVAIMGITEFAQSELGEIVFIELPEVGKVFESMESICVVESTKAASDVYAPVAGKVSEVNSALESNPELINDSPYDEGWMVKIEQPAQEDLNNLMSPPEYEAYVAEP